MSLKRKFQKILLALLFIKSKNRYQKEKGKLTAILILISAFLNTVIILVNIIVLIQHYSLEDVIYLVEDIVLFILFIFLFLLNRNGYIKTAAYITSFLFLIGFITLLPSNTISSTIFNATCPIIISSFIISPVYAFIFTGLSVVIQYLFQTFIIHQQYSIDSLMVIVLLFIAFLSWIISRNFNKFFLRLQKSTDRLRISYDQTKKLSENLKELNTNLEKKVDERTDELKNTLNKLWGEMELAKKIQTVLLPQNPVISGYDISCFMEPAYEVGGDYYDVISIKDYNWLVIGDVSGHGVPAGLIMMMVQTSIRTVLTANPEIEPSRLLEIVNKTITDNIVLIDANKYMTITVLKVEQNGDFGYSGLHQDIILYRKKTNSIEIVETRGMWLGLIDEKNCFFMNDSFHLEKGDCALLFTDGVIEARYIETETGCINQFGQEKLMHLFKKSQIQALSCKEIQSKIITELDNFEHTDDLTLLLIKKEV